MQRLEVALWQYGFQNDNSIACVNLCRDEVTHTLKHKIDQIFGSSFSTHGLGGVLTCGVTGVGAGLSHSPVDESSGKERYVFFSFPHIGIDSKGVVGNISRPGRAGMSCACGAVIKALGDIKSEGLQCNCKEPGVHEPLNIEFSILKQRLARRLVAEGQTDQSVTNLDLVELTKVTERVISDDLDFLISKAVNPAKADYAVVTGVQVHNWAEEFDSAEPNLEWVAPVNVYAVVDGKRYDIDLSRLPGLTPRQIRLLASAPDAHQPSPSAAAEAVCNSGGASTLREIDPPYMYSSKEARRRAKSRMESFARLASAAPAAPAQQPVAPPKPAQAAQPSTPAAAAAAPAQQPASNGNTPSAVAASAAAIVAPVKEVAQVAAKIEEDDDQYWTSADEEMLQAWTKVIDPEA
ncbi:hypothetical protein N2152v2_000739 [Parachlorella kessleri]